MMKLLGHNISKLNNGLFKNFFFLSISQGLNFLLPLLTFPFQVRVLGVEGFGLISFASVFISYFSIITDYGFNLIGVREIALNRDNENKLAEIFNSIIAIKTILMIICFIIYFILITFVDRFSENKEIYLLTFGIVLGQTFYPIWFFQGIEKMKTITILNVVSKLIFTIGIFVFVRTKDDISLVPLFNSLGFILIAIISMIVVNKRYNISFKIPSLQSVKYYFKSSWYIFISNVSVTLYTSTTTFLLGFLTNNTCVGYFSIANKIISAIRAMFDPFSQVLFPYLTKLYKDNPLLALNTKKKVFKIGLVIILPLSVVLFIYSPELLRYVFKITSHEALANLRIQSLIPIYILFHIIWGLLTIIVLNYNRDYSKIIISASIFSLPLSYVLIYLFKDIGASLSIMIIELYITIRYLLFCRFKYKKFIY